VRRQCVDSEYTEEKLLTVVFLCVLGFKKMFLAFIRVLFSLCFSI